ncbi:MAG: thioredoxin family protein [[Clostridium] innocuum]
MKHVRMMYLKGCPHCKAAFAMVKELQDSYPELRGVNIEAIEEQEQKKLADSLDYWYVPTYFVDGVKLLEGVPTKEKVECCAACRIIGLQAFEIIKKNTVAIQIMYG